jgi:hypothetical protein
MGIKSVDGKVLCEKNNNELSNFDDELTNFYKAIQEMVFNKEKNLYIEIDGNKLEKALIKLAFDSINIRVRDKNLKMKQGFLELLFSKSRLRKPMGLYFDVNPYHFKEFDYVIKSSAKNNEVLSVEVNIGMLKMNLVLGKPDNPSAFGLYRPSRLAFERYDSKISSSIRLINFNASNPSMNYFKSSDESREYADHWPQKVKDFFSII